MVSVSFGTKLNRKSEQLWREMLFFPLFYRVCIMYEIHFISLAALSLCYCAVYALNDSQPSGRIGWGRIRLKSEWVSQLMLECVSSDTLCIRSYTSHITSQSGVKTALFSSFTECLLYHIIYSIHPSIHISYHIPVGDENCSFFPAYIYRV